MMFWGGNGVDFSPNEGDRSLAVGLGLHYHV